MFEIVEKAASASVHLVGVGDAGGDAVRAGRDPGTLGVARYVVIDGSVADFSWGLPGEGIGLMPDRPKASASATLADERCAVGGLISDRFSMLRAQVEDALRTGEIILVVLHMRDPGNGVVAGRSRKLLVGKLRWSSALRSFLRRRRSRCRTSCYLGVQIGKAGANMDSTGQQASYWRPMRALREVWFHHSYGG